MIQPIAKNFSGTEFKNKAAGFQGPTQLPCDEAQRRKWQSVNRAWWESTPMRYDWREPLTAPVATKAFFEELDSRFLASVYKYMPWKDVPFEMLIPFKQLADQRRARNWHWFGNPCSTPVAILQVVHRDRFDRDGIGFNCAETSAIRVAGSSTSNGCRRYAIRLQQF